MIASMQSIPENCAPYKRTPTFDEVSVPKGLLKSHRTKAGTWGRIVVLEGKLLYRILQPELEERLLDPSRSGVVEPGIPHEVEPLGRVRFYVEFYRP